MGAVILAIAFILYSVLRFILLHCLLEEIIEVEAGNHNYQYSQVKANSYILRRVARNLQWGWGTSGTWGKAPNRGAPNYRRPPLENFVIFE